MCLIIYRPAGEKIPTIALEMAAAQNPDGFGLMYSQDDSLCVMRTLDMDRGVDWVEQVPDDVNLAVHFRLATHGGVNRRNTHPFKVIDGLYMMHNGILPVKDTKNLRSDTCVFAQDILRPMLANDPTLWDRNSFRTLVELAAGDYNKLLFMGSNGEVTIANEKAGRWLDGIWLSTPDPGRYGLGKYASGRKVTITGSGKVSYPTQYYSDGTEDDEYSDWWKQNGHKYSTSTTGNKLALPYSSPAYQCDGCGCDCSGCGCFQESGDACEVCDCVLVPKEEDETVTLMDVLAAADAQQEEDDRFYQEKLVAAVANGDLLPAAISR